MTNPFIARIDGFPHLLKSKPDAVEKGLKREYICKIYTKSGCLKKIATDLYTMNYHRS